jgi:hypothetical protein
VLQVLESREDPEANSGSMVWPCGGMGPAGKSLMRDLVGGSGELSLEAVSAVGNESTTYYGRLLDFLKQTLLCPDAF